MPEDFGYLRRGSCEVEGFFYQTFQIIVGGIDGGVADPADACPSQLLRDGLSPTSTGFGVCADAGNIDNNLVLVSLVADDTGFDILGS